MSDLRSFIEKHDPTTIGLYLSEVLLMVALKTDQPNIQRRVDSILAAAEPVQPNTEPVVWAKPIGEFVAADLDALAALIGWKAVERLRIGAVAGALATASGSDAPAEASNQESRGE